MNELENRCVLVPVSEYGEFGAMFSLCRTIEAELGLHPVFVFTWGYGMLKEHSRLVEIERWSWFQMGDGQKSLYTRMDRRTLNNYLPSQTVVEADRQGRGAWPVWKIAAGFAGGFLLLAGVIESIGNRVRVLTRTRRRMRASMKQAVKIVALTSPKLVLSGQDFPLSVTSVLAAAAGKRGIQTAIIPFSMPPTTREIIESFAYFGLGKVRGPYRYVARLLIPTWLNERRGETYARADLGDAIAARLAGLEPPVPWLPNSGRGVLFVPSKWAYSYYERAGIPSKQLRLTGAAWSDKLVASAATREERRKILIGNLLSGIPRRYKRPHKQKVSELDWKLIVVSWPTNQYPRKANGCDSYEDLWRQYISALQHLQALYSVCAAVSLHPTVSDPKLLTMLRKAGIPVVRDALITYVDCADVFISPVSSTAFWALQCGVPTINFDGYLYGYTEFDEAGAITVTSPHEMGHVAARLLDDQPYVEETRRRIAASMELFAIRDGQSMRRILDELRRLAGMCGQTAD